jgi:hypothetical protein
MFDFALSIYTSTTNVVSLLFLCMYVCVYVYIYLFMLVLFQKSNIRQHERFQVLAAAIRETPVLCVVAPCLAASTSETSVNFYQTTRRNNLEDGQLLLTAHVKKLFLDVNFLNSSILSSVT